jgi:hypothetical protein
MGLFFPSTIQLETLRDWTVGLYLPLRFSEPRLYAKPRIQKNRGRKPPGRRYFGLFCLPLSTQSGYRRRRFNAPIPFEHDGNNCGSVNGFGSTTAGLFAVGAGPFGGVNSFYSIDPTTGAPTLIGSTGIIAGGGRGFLSASNDSSKLYWEVQNGSVDSLYSITTSTGAATLIGTEDESFPRQQNGNPFSMVFTGGTLWANFFSLDLGRSTPSADVTPSFRRTHRRLR